MELLEIGSKIVVNGREAEIIGVLVQHYRIGKNYSEGSYTMYLLEKGEKRKWLEQDNGNWRYWEESKTAPLNDLFGLAQYCIKEEISVLGKEVTGVLDRGVLDKEIIKGKVLEEGEIKAVLATEEIEDIRLGERGKYADGEYNEGLFSIGVWGDKVSYYIGKKVRVEIL